jgi:lysophospholipase L1-like esterase
MRHRINACAAAVLVIALLSPASSAQTSSGEHWVGTWTTATIGRPPYPPPATTATPANPAPQNRVPFPSNQTLRQIVHTSIGGSRVRVVVTNAFGTAPLEIGAAYVALRDKQAALVSGSGQALTFSGRTTATLPAGAVMVSDPAALKIPDFADVAVDLFIGGDTSAQTLTIHRAALQTNYLAAGNKAGAADLPEASTVPSWFFLERVEVSTSDRTAAVVTLGDSITDGAGSTAEANSRWPDVFARRLAAAKGSVKTAVLNTGIGGNRVLSESIPEFGVNVLARFDRDVLAQPGVTHVVVMEGINDIGQARESASPSAADLIAGHKQLIERAHAHGLKIIGATLTPFEGAAYYTDVGEQKRAAINDWIRTSKAYDGVIDFDAATRDPQQPKRFLPQYDRGDHLHPSDAGYQAMANAIQLSLFAR